MLIIALLLLLHLRPGLAQMMLPSGVQSPNQGRLEATQVSGSLIGIQYEHWFEGPSSWRTAEAVPVLGKYTTNETTISTHFSQFRQLGIDWLLIDWSNMLWTKPDWELHSGETRDLEAKTEVLFQTALHLHDKGKYAPKLVFMIGLQNGPPVPNGVRRLNGELEWLETNFLNRPEYQDLWLYEERKPLLVIIYWPPNPCERLPQDLAHDHLNAERWTVRWMSAQLQDNHADQCGMWSLMDRVIPRSSVPAKLESCFRQQAKIYTGSPVERVHRAAGWSWDSRGLLGTTRANTAPATGPFNRLRRRVQLPA